MLQALVFLFIISCSEKQVPETKKTDRSDDRSGEKTLAQSVPDTPKVTEAPSVRRGLIYDLRRARAYTQKVDAAGRVLETIYTLINGQEINIHYTWDGGSNRCTRATAMIKDRKLAEAEFIGLGGDEQKGYVLKVREIQFDDDGRIVYKAQITFDFSYRKGKLAEWPEEGNKIYELFLKWGSLT
jgi:hypothetical protein